MNFSTATSRSRGLLVVGIFVGFVGSAPSQPDGDVTAKDFRMQALPHARVIVTDAYGLRHPVVVEVAATSASRTRGLMWRTQLAPGKGMLFVFPAEGQLSFWMKNTLIPLDMVFINVSGEIVDIIERCTPGSLSIREPRGIAKYVLEVPGGWASQIGLAPGLKVLLEGVRGIAVTEEHD